MASEPAHPPQPPSIRPRLRMHRAELIGICLIGAVPVLGLLGAFGPRTERAAGQAPALELRVRYPAVLRHQMRESIEAHVSNRTDRPLDRVELSFTDAYLAAFSGVAFVPAADRAYAVSLPAIGPGETRLVTVEVRAERYGRHRGRIVASHAGDRASVEVSSFVFP